MSQLWGFLAGALPTVAAFATSLSSIDLTYHVRAGELMLQTGRVLRVDPFTFTANNSQWLDQQWGGQILLALAGRGGWLVLAAMRGLLVGAIFLLLYLCVRGRGVPARRAALLAIASFVVTMGGLGLRPQLLGLTLFALSWWVLERRDRRPMGIWALPLITAVWTNVHGSFFMGPALLLLAAMDERRRGPSATRRASFVTIATLAATALNPFGPRVWSYAVGIATNPEVTRTVSEWQPPTLREPSDAVFFVSVFAIAFLLVTRRISLDGLSLFTLAGFLIIALLAIRGVMWWAFVAPAVVGRAMAGPDEAEHRSSPLNLGLALTLSVAGLMLLLRWRDQPATLPSSELVRDVPTGITVALREGLGPGMRVFNAQKWGSWLEYAFPEVPVFVDSRIELFPSSVWRDYFAVSGGREGWQAILERWDVDVVVAAADQQEELIPRIRSTAGWRVLYEDSLGAVFVRG